jgi:hypothetical protein
MKEKITKAFEKIRTLVDTAATNLEGLAAASPKAVMVVGALLGVGLVGSTLAAAWHLLPVLIEWVTATVVLGFRLVTITLISVTAYLSMKTAVVAYKKIPSSKPNVPPAPASPSSQA